jgi:hypothetical protein
MLQPPPSRFSNPTLPSTALMRTLKLATPLPSVPGSALNEMLDSVIPRITMADVMLHITSAP